MTRAQLLVVAFWLVMLVIAESCGQMDSIYENSHIGYGRSVNRNGYRRKVYKRYQCDTGFGMGGGGGFGGMGGSFGDIPIIPGGGLLGAGLGAGPAGFGLGEMDPTTFLLYALLGGGGVGSPVSPIPTPLNGPGVIPADDSRLVPLPPSGPQKAPTTEPPPIKPMLDDLSDELSYGLRPPAPPPQPDTNVVSADVAEAGADGDAKPKGHVTPGNRCEEDADCVVNAACVEALRQKYCVCTAGWRPKGGVCV